MKPRSRLLYLAVIATALCGSAAQADEPSTTPSTHREPIIDFASCAKPVYPPASLAAGEVGTVSLGFLINADGSMLESRVNKSSGSDALDQAAREGIMKCKFIPAVDKGKGVKEWATIQYRWQLK
jgi:TonB family protein